MGLRQRGRAQGGHHGPGRVAAVLDRADVPFQGQNLRYPHVNAANYGR